MHFTVQETSRTAIPQSCGQYNQCKLHVRLLIKEGIYSDTLKFQSLTCQRHEVVVAFTVAESPSKTTQGKTPGKFSSACHYKLCRPFSRTYVILPVETHRSCTTFQQVILKKSPIEICLCFGRIKG